MQKGLCLHKYIVCSIPASNIKFAKSIYIQITVILNSLGRYLTLSELTLNIIDEETLQKKISFSFARPGTTDSQADTTEGPQCRDLGFKSQQSLFCIRLEFPFVSPYLCLVISCSLLDESNSCSYLSQNKKKTSLEEIKKQFNPNCLF